jgi:hypothetical protein
MENTASLDDLGILLAVGKGKICLAVWEVRNVSGKGLPPEEFCHAMR